MTDMSTDRLLLWLLRANAGILILAAPCALLPFAWMDAVHRDALGLGELPDIPITKYMARSLSLTYALHGCVVLSLTIAWPRYRELVPVLASLHILFGFAMFCLDWATGMPVFWRLGEGPTIIAYAVLILAVHRRASRVKEYVQG